MEYRYYLGYKVYENGDVENKKGIILTPKLKGNYSYYEIKGKNIRAGEFVLFAFEIYPKSLNQLIKRKDNNPLNNSLENISW